MLIWKIDYKVAIAPHRHELSDAEWTLLQPLLPAIETPGQRYQDHRRLLNGMLFRISTGVPWRDLPDRYGPWQTVYSRYRRWSRNCLWDRILNTSLKEARAVATRFEKLAVHYLGSIKLAMIRRYLRIATLSNTA